MNIQLLVAALTLLRKLFLWAITLNLNMETLSVTRGLQVFPSLSNSKKTTISSKNHPVDSAPCLRVITPSTQEEFFSALVCKVPFKHLP